MSRNFMIMESAVHFGEHNQLMYLIEMFMLILWFLAWMWVMVCPWSSILMLIAGILWTMTL